MRRIRQLVGEAATEALRILTFSSAALAVALGGLAAQLGFIWLWPLAVAAAVPTVVAGTAWTARNYRAPDRLPIEWSWDNRLWFIGFGLVCAITVAGIEFMVTGGVRGLILGGPMFLIGGVILALIVRHFRKPIRPPDPIVRAHGACADDPQG